MQKIIHVLNIKASKTEVYDAIATIKGLSNWWSTVVKGSEEVGEIVNFKFIEVFNPDMKITALNKPNEIGWTCVSGHDLWKDNTFSFELSESEGGTQLKFTQTYANPVSDEEYGIICKAFKNTAKQVKESHFLLEIN